MTASNNARKFLVYIVQDGLDKQKMAVPTDYDVRNFSNNPVFFRAYKKRKPNLIILDSLSDNRRGEQLLDFIKVHAAKGDARILAIVSEQTIRDKIEGLHLGQKICIVSSITPANLALYSEDGLKQKPTKNKMKFGNIILNLDNHKVTKGKTTFHLTDAEFPIFKALMGKAGTVVPRKRLIIALWGNARSMGTRTIDMHIGSIRKKLNDSAGTIVQTVYGVGYRLNGN